MDALPPLPALEALKLYDACLNIDATGEGDLECVQEDAVALANAYPHLSSLTFYDSNHGSKWEGPHALLAMNALARMQRALGPRIALVIE